MENLEEVQEFYKKWFGRFIILTFFAVIIAVASIGANILMFMNYNSVINQQQELMDRYDVTVKTFQEYDIRVEMNTTWLDYSSNLRYISQNGDPIPHWDNDSLIDYWEYQFHTDQIDINTTENPFRWMYMKVSVPIKAYDVFRSISCKWTIEDNEGILTKQHFDTVDYSQYYMVTVFDISSYMWKELVPNEVTVDITLTV